MARKNLRKNFNEENFWNIVFTLGYLACIVVALIILRRVYGGAVPIDIDPFDALILMLATFRLVRLFVHDSIMQYVKDWFLDVKEIEREGRVEVERNVPEDGFRLTMTRLLSCSWCTGMWTALLVVFLYYFTPLAWFPLLVLAVAGVASFFQIFASFVANAQVKKE